jgi:hypothetical protein
MSHFRVRWKRQGHHVYARVFAAGHETGGYAMNGMLVFREDEWFAFARCFDSDGSDTVKFIPEENQP